MLHVGIIGVGNISRSHISAYQTFPEECAISALCDTAPGRAAAAREELGLEGVRVYESPAEMLEAEDLDLVSIATPPSTHAELAIEALEAGVHVLVEKPMAPSLEECDRMIAAARQAGRKLSVVAQNRFRDDTSTLKEVLDSGLAGPLTHAQIDSSWWRGLPYYDLWWRGTWESEGGGCTLNHAIHHLDMTLWMLGSPDAVTSVITNAAHENAEVEDLSVSILRYGRALAQVTASVVSHGEEQGMVLQCREARISQPWRTTAEASRPNGFPSAEGDAERTALIDEVAARHTPLEHTGHAGQIHDVIDAVAKGREPAVSAEDGRRAVELVTAIYASGIEQRTIALPLEESDPYYRSGTLVARAPHFFEKTAAVDEQAGEIFVGAKA